MKYRRRFRDSLVTDGIGLSGGLFILATSPRTAALESFDHHRAPATLEKQIVIRMNRDTLYSGSMYDFVRDLSLLIAVNSNQRWTLDLLKAAQPQRIIG